MLVADMDELLFQFMFDFLEDVDRLFFGLVGRAEVNSFGSGLIYVAVSLVGVGSARRETEG